MKYILSAFAALVVLPVILSCQSGSVKDPYDQIKKDNEAFLRGDKKGSETFRVLLSSDEYRVVQLKSQATIERAADDGAPGIPAGLFERLAVGDAEADESRIL